MRKVCGLILLLLCLLGGAVWAADVQVELNGDLVAMDNSTGMPFIDSAGRVMVPLRAVLEKAGKNVSFDSYNRIVLITGGSQAVSVPIDKDYVIIGREIKPNDAPARIVNGRTYLPIRIVMTSLGYQVSWDSLLSKVIITGPAGTVQEPSADQPPTAIPNTVGNSNINLYNGGLLARENDELYFVNFQDDERIWRINEKTGDSKRISERRARGINVVDGWVYYRQEATYGTWELFKTKMDGTGSKMLATGNTQWLKVENGYIYYYLSDEEALYRMKFTDLYGTKYYDQSMAAINLENGILVYVEIEEDSSGDMLPGNIIKVDIDSRLAETLSSERSGDTEPMVALIGKVLYFTRYNDALSLYGMDLTTGEVRKVNDRWTYNVTGDDQSLYTLYPDSPEGLYQLNLNGGEEKRLNTDWRPGIYHDPGMMLLDSKIYFLKKVTSNRYGWLSYDLVSKRLKSIDSPEDFLK